MHETFSSVLVDDGLRSGEDRWQSVWPSIDFQLYKPHLDPHMDHLTTTTEVDQSENFLIGAKWPLAEDY